MGVFVEGGPCKVGLVRRDQVFVAQQIGQLARRHLVLVDHRDKVTHCLAAPRHGFDQGQEGQIEEQHLVFGMVEDVEQLVRVQARVQGVQHRTAAGGGEIQLQVPVAVPGQRGDALRRLHTELAECMGHLTRAVMQLRIGGAVDVAFDAARDDGHIAAMRVGRDSCKKRQKVTYRYVFTNLFPTFFLGSFSNAESMDSTSSPWLANAI